MRDLRRNAMKREESMSLQRLHFLAVVTLAAAATSAALGQTAAPGFGPAGSGSQTQAPIPDFSTTWARLSLPGFEPPLSGPGPVTNRSRRPDGASNLLQLVGDYTIALHVDETAQTVDG